ncbi:hypothetical protein GQ457_17G000690 [Hibiscus cannabinus]
MLDIWHLRLGHPSKQRMKFFSSLNKAIPATFASECDTCHLAKHKRLPFPVSSSVSESVFDLLHMDVWGPFPVESLYGHFYFLTIVDDKSRFVWVYPMIYKSEVRNLIVNFCQMVQTQFSKLVKCIRTDNAKEFDMIIFFKEKGIVHQNSCVHTPQQNSVVERKHQHLLVVARALRLQASLPLSFWVDCVLHAASLINITPTPILHNKTPHEILFNSAPDFSTLKVFGCLTYASILPKPKTKMDPKAVRCVFIGYPKNMKGYRLFNLDTKEIFVSRDVVFCEQSFPFQKQVVLPVSDNNAGVDIFLHRNKMKSSCPGVFLKDTLFTSNTDALKTGGNHDSVSQQQHAQSEQQHAQSESVILSDSVEIAARPTRVRNLPSKFRDYQVSLPKARTSPHSIAQVLSYDKLSVSHSSYINNIDILKEPKNYKQAVMHDCWQTAMKEEIEALERNHTWDLVPLPPGKQTIGCKWVYKTKLKSDGSLERYKARLVAKGYTQQPGVDYLDTFSPVAKMTSIRTLLAVASAKEWCLQQLDINNAFLHGYLQEEVYMQLPPGLSCSDSNVVCKLNKSLYGLKQASRKWNERLTSALLQQGFKQASSDSSFFIKGKGSDIVILAVYVDDIILAGPNANDIKRFLHETFRIKDLGNLKYFF